MTSAIGCYTESGTIKACYYGEDTSAPEVGFILIKDWNTWEQAEALVSLGDINYLDPGCNVGVGEPITFEFDNEKDFIEAMSDLGVESLFLFMEDSDIDAGATWYVKSSMDDDFVPIVAHVMREELGYLTGTA